MIPTRILPSFRNFYTHRQHVVDVSTDVPSYRKVVHPKWLHVMASKIDALARIGTWNLISLPRSRLITCKWVYKAKTDDTLEHNKARLVERTWS